MDTTFNGGYSGEISNLMAFSHSSSTDQGWEDKRIAEELGLADLSSIGRHTLVGADECDNASALNLFGHDHGSAIPSLSVELNPSVSNEADVNLGTKKGTLVQLSKKKKSSYMRNVDNIIAMKPLNKDKSDPGRIHFILAKSSLIQKHDKVKVFIRDYDKIDPVLWQCTESNDKYCPCFHSHPLSTFCLRSREDENRVTWTMDSDVTAHVYVGNIDKFDLQFTPIICSSKFKKRASQLLQLVFQVEKFSEIIEQSYFIKFCALPSRDIQTFVDTLMKRNLVSSSLGPVKQEKHATHNRMCVVKVSYYPRDAEELVQVVRSLNGKIV